MDDKDKKIDFSNQPLGLMAQEGEKIENELNSEFQKNEEARKNKVQENPFASLADAKNEAPSTPKPMQATHEPPPPPFNRIPKALEDQVAKPAQPVQQQVAKPVQQPVQQPVAQPEPQPTQQVPISQPNDQKQQDINAYLAKAKKENNSDIPEQPGSWGIFVFIILIALVGGAVYLFKSGKIDELTGTKEEEVEKKDDDEPKVETTKINGHTVEKLRNFRIKETIYIADSTSVTYTNEGIVDLENGVAKFNTTAHIIGMSSKMINQYCDYNINICYYDDPDNRSLWHKEAHTPGFLGPDEIYEFIERIGTGNEVTKDNYETYITGDDVFRIIEPNEYIDANKLKNASLKLEYSMANNRVRKIKIDLSTVLNVGEAFIAQEFSEINKNAPLTIPEDIVKKAQ